MRGLELAAAHHSHALVAAVILIALVVVLQDLERIFCMVPKQPPVHACLDRDSATWTDATSGDESTYPSTVYRIKGVPSFWPFHHHIDGLKVVAPVEHTLLYGPAADLDFNDMSAYQRLKHAEEEDFQRWWLPDEATKSTYARLRLYDPTKVQQH